MGEKNNINWWVYRIFFPINSYSLNTVDGWNPKQPPGMDETL